jgi:hypothetical protein
LEQNQKLLFSFFKTPIEEIGEILKEKIPNSFRNLGFYMQTYKVLETLQDI